MIASMSVSETHTWTSFALRIVRGFRGSAARYAASRPRYRELSVKKKDMISVPTVVSITATLISVSGAPMPIMMSSILLSTM